MTSNQTPSAAAERGALNREVHCNAVNILTHINAEVKSPLKSIRAHCIWCCNASSLEVRLCPAEACPSHALRTGHRPKGIKSVRPLKVVRARCLDCSGGSSDEVKACRFEKCPLFPYRSGHNPKLTGRKLPTGHPFAKYASRGDVLACGIKNMMVDMEAK